MPKPILYLLLTILFEAPIYGLGLRKKPLWQVAVFIVLINGFTHPLLTWAHQELHWNLWLLEGTVALVEGLFVFLIFREKLGISLAIGIFANAFSLFLGFLLIYLGWL